jgi:hypothetical protein
MKREKNRKEESEKRKKEKTRYFEKDKKLIREGVRN